MSQTRPSPAAKPKARVCFLYIAQAHQVLHSLSAAVELARSRPDIQVDVAATSAEVLDYARLLSDLLGRAPIHWVLLGPGWLRNGPQVDGGPPKAPMLVLNAPRLARYDVIVAPERTTTLLRKFGVKAKLVYTQHGAGDRAGPFEPRLGLFDLVFAAGPKQYDRMVDSGLVKPERCAVVGYPKFELVDRLHPTLPRLFDNDRPTVLYNPHFSRTLGSWRAWGLPLLARFADQSRYNLIFAPHLRLFGGRAPQAVPELAPYLNCPHIHMDLGDTTAAIDMTYTRAADVYVGDVSSQIYEFLRTPRPCVFLNPEGVAWQDDESYRHWRCGPVVDRLGQFEAALETAQTDLPSYLSEQRDAFSTTFDESGSPSVRSAQAIARLATGEAAPAAEPLRAAAA